MNKIHLISGLVAFTLLSASYLSAQTFPVTGGGTITPTIAPAGTSACVSIARDLAYGSRGADVTALQKFLVGENYPGSGTWMITGYFGSATRQAVKNFQGKRGIAPTGIADAQTRAAIQDAACGRTTYTLFDSAPAIVNTYSGNLSVNSLSATAGNTGTSVTVYGGGFDPIYNNVYFGAIPIRGNIASNGASLTFTVPHSYTPSCGGMSNCFSGTQYLSPGIYPVYVTNSRGMSNSIPFTLLSGGNTACSLSAGYGSCAYGYGYGNYGAYANANITSMYPLSGSVGTHVTVLGSGFSRRGNAVHFGTGVITDLTSMDGTSLSFTVPSQLTGYGSQSLTLSTYNVSVSNESGVTSNTVPFTVTSLAGSASPAAILSVSGPALLTVGTQGVWTVTVNNQSNYNASVSVRWGDEGTVNVPAAYSQPVTVGGTQVFTFSHIYQTGGDYLAVFGVSNNSGVQSSTVAFVAVRPMGTGNSLSLANISPILGRVGTLVTLSGTGFTQAGNTIRFGIGGTLNVTSSQNGTTLYYTIPYAVSACDTIGSICTAPAALVSAGTYPVYVSNAAGQTQTLNFQVLLAT